MTDTSTTRTVDGVELPAPGRWAIDASHSSVEASVRHLGLSKVRGAFRSFTGAIEVAERVVVGEYYAPHISHVSMEPPVATARWEAATP